MIVDVIIVNYGGSLRKLQIDKSRLHGRPTYTRTALAELTASSSRVAVVDRHVI
jgi:hypothetical protein